ncbi:MAG: hypothetical protein HY425_02290 [Candidatus Levybacteria bacterium]|nr:hypothetical protein [Candidatus Levybacteria bacterium]
MVESFNYKSLEKKETTQQSPYVVSQDIGILMKKWAKERNFNLPNEEFITQLRSEFAQFMKRIFPSFESVNENELSNGLRSLVESTELFSISLDRVYFQSNPSIDISRLVDNEGKDKGLGRRRDSSSLLGQFKKLKKLDIKEAVLVDDVVFSGSLVERIMNVLSDINIKIPVICAGIAIKEGIDIIAKSGKELRAVKIYDKVIDEVCERDFYPGVPFCGRSLNSCDNVGIPYILPFGDPGKWASIPQEWQKPFSQFCLRQSIKLFEKVENCSGRYIYCSDLDRKIISLPSNNTRFISSLKQFLQEI